MAVYLETSLGDVVFDLYVQRCPVGAKNFIRLCKSGYYDGCLFYNLERGFITQCGDRTGTGSGSASYEGSLFARELPKSVKHNKIGIIGYSHNGRNVESSQAKVNGSQFYITLRDSIDYLDGKYTAFGCLAEDNDGVIKQLNSIPTDEGGRPLSDVRIVKAHVLDDPFALLADSGGMKGATQDGINAVFHTVPCNNGDNRPKEEVVAPRIPWKKLNGDEQTQKQRQLPTEESTTPGGAVDVREKKNADNAAKTLEILGDLPSVDTKPPETVLFVCKLNSVTDSNALELIFSRFGAIKSCEVVRDWKTGDSLQYAFIEYEKEESCNEAYIKMNNVKIDDRRIHVDFSQSVSREWNAFRRRHVKGAYGKKRDNRVEHGTGNVKRRWEEGSNRDNNASNGTKRRRWEESG